MIESTTVQTLRHKRDEITAAIANYEKRLAQSRADWPT
jgi:predicted component of type VI protein secretion system